MVYNMMSLRWLAVVWVCLALAGVRAMDDDMMHPPVAYSSSDNHFITVLEGQPFYLSTGTSNGGTYGDMLDYTWLPFGYFGPIMGWKDGLYKDLEESEITPSNKFFWSLYKGSREGAGAWANSLCEAYCEATKDPKDPKALDPSDPTVMCHKLQVRKRLPPGMDVKNQPRTVCARFVFLHWGTEKSLLLNARFVNTDLHAEALYKEPIQKLLVPLYDFIRKKHGLRADVRPIMPDQWLKIIGHKVSAAEVAPDMPVVLFPDNNQWLEQAGATSLDDWHDFLAKYLDKHPDFRPTPNQMKGDRSPLRRSGSSSSPTSTPLRRSSSSPTSTPKLLSDSSGSPTSTRRSTSSRSSSPTSTPKEPSKN